MSKKNTQEIDPRMWAQKTAEEQVAQQQAEQQKAAEEQAYQQGKAEEAARLRTPGRPSYGETDYENNGQNLKEGKSTNSQFIVDENGIIVRNKDYSKPKVGPITETVETKKDETTQPGEKKDVTPVSVTKATNEVVNNPELTDAQVYAQLANLYEKPISPEEQQRRERAAAVSSGVLNLGNALGSLGNLFFVNKGAYPQKLPEVPSYGDTIDRYRESLGNARNNYASLQQRILQLRQARDAQAAQAANDKAKADAYTKAQEALAAAHDAQKKVYEETARGKNIENNWEESPEFQEYQRRTGKAKAENEEAKVGATKALESQRIASTNKSNRDTSNNGGKGGKGGGGRTTTYPVDDGKGGRENLTAEQIRKLAFDLGIDSRKTTGRGSKAKSSDKTVTELAKEVGEARRKQNSATKRRSSGTTGVVAGTGADGKGKLGKRVK